MDRGGGQEAVADVSRRIRTAHHRRGAGPPSSYDNRSKAQASRRSMPDELSLAVAGARFDNVKRKGKPKGSLQIDTGGLQCASG